MAGSIFHLQIGGVSTAPTSRVSKCERFHVHAQHQLLRGTRWSACKILNMSISKQSRRFKVRAGGSGDGKEKKVPLWRKELSTLENPTGESFPMRDENDDFLPDSTMEEDIARLRKKRELEKKIEYFERTGNSSPMDETKGDGFAKTFAEKFLVADFFFILFILAWLVAGLGERSFLESTTLIDSWLPLWPTLFQPALGLFMAGAIVSAISGFLSRSEGTK